MKRRSFLHNTAGAAGLVLFGCGDDALPIFDGGAAPDSGSDAGTDAGPPLDAGSDAGGDAGPDTPPMCGNVTFIMGEDHDDPHAEGIEFPAADVIAGVEKTYDITGASRHPHTLVVRAEDFARLAAGESVTIRSSYDERHDHDVILRCGPVA